MKLLTICLATACLQASASGYTQEVSLFLKDAPLEKAFNEISKQTGSPFLYTEQILRDAKHVTLELSRVSLKDAIEACMKGQPLTWQKINGTIVISRRPITAVRLNDTLREIRGTVQGSGTPVSGASIMIQGTGKGTYTDNNGNFILKVASTENTLIITSVGYERQEVNIQGRNLITIFLNASANKLDDAIVIAYGTTTQRMNTGNVSNVSAAEIQRQPVSNVLGALQGRMAGVLIQQSTGMPGGAFKVQIRGRNSIRSEANDPLYLVNGVPFPASSVAASITSGVIKGGSPLNYLNPADIESIEVLKDADATAIYGSRGANGVILITTKKGKEGKTSVSLDISQGYGKVANKMDLLNAREYLDMRYEAFKNDQVDFGDPSVYAPDLQLWDTTRDTDWQDKLIGGTAKFSRVNINLSGGGKFTQFLLGANYLKETTVLPGDFADEKKSLHLNVQHRNSNEKFRITLTATYLLDKNNLPTQDVTTNSLQLPPVAPDPILSTGQINWENGTFPFNPYSFLSRTYKSTGSNILANIQLGYQLFKGLELKMNGGYTKMNVDEKALTPAISEYPIPPSGNSIFSMNSVQTSILEPQVEYHRTSKIGKINVLVGSTSQQSEQTGQSIIGAGFSSDALLQNIQAAPILFFQANKNIRYKYQAVFARFNYQYAERYLLNLTGRRDGSSRFGPGKQFANFGAIGAGWIFTQEKWMKDIFNALSYGKLRANAGITGSDQTTDYGFLDLWNSTASPYAGSQGLYPNNLYNPSFAWESNKKLEAGVELGFLRDKVIFNLSLYRNRSSNQLVGLPLSAVTGFSFIQYNLPATVQNQGYEIEFTGYLIENKKLNWSSSLNISFARNTLISYPNLSSSLYSEMYIVGQSLSVKKTFIFKGIDPQSGFFHVEDVDKDGNFTMASDGARYKNPSPTAFGGWENSFKFLGFQLDFLLQFVKQTTFNYSSFFPAAGALHNQPENVLNRWNLSNSNATYQQFSDNFGYTSLDLYAQSDAAIEDASFIRLKNLSFSFSGFKNLSKKLKIERVKIYTIAQNLLTFTAYSGLDPETLDYGSLPPLRMMTIGVQVTF